ncbi:MAG: Rpn family recombination-promoting nuclease/putative transposase [Lachnospiraceae bacterium]|nr:Rpn family recombination-promoting nuclease/putative transposase [Lachnospiraceae bacterium]
MSTTGQQDKDLQRLAQLRPIDDDFMRCLLKDNIPLAEFVLRIITDKKDLVITDCETQRDMKRLAGARSICLDAYGTDADGKKYDLEVQKANDGADPHRARYHSSVMDVENLHSGQDYKELPDTYIIFFTEKDFYGMGKPVYPIERMNLATEKPFTDGEHILYVNGEYRGDSDLGKLMHDFNCMNADDMNFELVAERTRYFKENPEGVKQMCKIMEDMRNETRKETLKESAVNTAKRMIAAGKYVLDEIANISGLSLEEVKQLQADKNA